MRKAIPMACVLLASAVAGGLSQVRALSAQPTSDAVTKWEYRVLTKEQVIDLGKKDLATGLNMLGDEGWELAAVETAYIFKRPKQQKELEDIKRQVSVAESDVERQKDRVAWSERMAKKGYLSDKQVQLETQRLKAAEVALDKAKRELKAIPTEPKKAPEKNLKPEQQ